MILTEEMEELWFYLKRWKHAAKSTSGVWSFRGKPSSEVLVSLEKL